MNKNKLNCQKIRRLNAMQKCCIFLGLKKLIKMQYKKSFVCFSFLFKNQSNKNEGNEIQQYDGRKEIHIQTKNGAGKTSTQQPNKSAIFHLSQQQLFLVRERKKKGKRRANTFPISNFSFLIHPQQRVAKGKESTGLQTITLPLSCTTVLACSSTYTKNFLFEQSMYQN